MKRPRRNPQSADALEHPFVVLVRSFDPTGEELPRWEPLVRDADGRPEFFSEARAKAAALNPPRDADLHVGDLIAAVPVDALSDIDNQAHTLFVVTPDGVWSAFQVPRSLSGTVAWTGAWGHSAEGMLRRSALVDRRRLVLAACDCAETALHLVPAGENRPRIALETARAWCLGHATRNDVQRAAEAASLATQTTNTDLGYAAHAANFAASVAYLKSDVDAARLAGQAAELAATARSQAAYNAAMREMAPTVERWIPLSVLLLSMLGYPNAIPLNPGNEARRGPRANPSRPYNPRKPRR